MATDSLTRLEILKDVCFQKMLLKPDGTPSPGALAKAIDRKVNYCSDLLHGRSSFGEEVARHIEDKLGLPKWHLDGGAGWPFPQLARERFDALEAWQKTEIQGIVRDRIDGYERARAGNIRAA